MAEVIEFIMFETETYECACRTALRPCLINHSGRYVREEDYNALLERHKRLANAVTTLSAAANCIEGEHVIGWDALIDACIACETALAEEE